MSIEKTLVLVKPDGVQRRLVGDVISRLERKGLQLLAAKFSWLTDEILRDHYSHLLDKPFFPEIAAFMQKAPVFISCWGGIDAVSTVRSLCGITKARDAQPGTIRGDFAMSIQANIVHASDSVEAAQGELMRFFAPSEILLFDDHLKDYVYSKSEQEFAL